MNDIRVLSLLAMPITFLFFVLIVENRYLKRRIKRLKAKLDEADIKLDEANTKYKVALLGFDPMECDECHLSGDCPLCGAE